MTHAIAGIWIILAPCLFLLVFVCLLNRWAEMQPTIIKALLAILTFVALVGLMWGSFVIILFALMGCWP